MDFQFYHNKISVHFPSPVTFCGWSKVVGAKVGAPLFILVYIIIIPTEQQSGHLRDGYRRQQSYGSKTCEKQANFSIVALVSYILF